MASSLDVTRPSTLTSTAAPARAPGRRRLRPSGEVVVVAAIVLLSAVVHAGNMFGFPYYENDEGTYISRAWEFISTGALDVYTYRYDHAPGGWMLLGAWLGITGGASLFDSMLQSGRVFMLLVHTASSVVLYLIARRMSGGMTAGVIAVLIFAVSPLGVYFQRRVLLDNMMIFWVLLAVLLLLRRQLRLSSVIVSGVLFGVAVLTKFSAAFFGLGFLVLLWMLSAHHQRRHALTMWLAFGGGTVVLFILYAALNNEFFRAPLGPDGDPLHVSLIARPTPRPATGAPAPTGPAPARRTRAPARPGPGPTPGARRPSRRRHRR